jgi:hypothetical protein
MTPAVLAIGLCALAWVAVAAGAVVRVALRARWPYGPVSSGEAILPLAYEIDGDEPDRRFRTRLDVAAELARRHAVPVWCLGGHPGWLDHSCAWYTKRYLLRRGLAPEAIRTLDDLPFLGESLDTTQEILAAVDLARHERQRRIVFVSDLLHLAQIRLILDGHPIRPIWVVTPLGLSLRLRDLRYVAVRIAMIFVTLLDREGWTLGWLRSWRRHAAGPRRRTARAAR